MPGIRYSAPWLTSAWGMVKALPSACPGCCTACELEVNDKVPINIELFQSKVQPGSWPAVYTGRDRTRLIRVLFCQRSPTEVYT